MWFYVFPNLSLTGHIVAYYSRTYQQFSQEKQTTIMCCSIRIVITKRMSSMFAPFNIIRNISFVCCQLFPLQKKKTQPKNRNKNISSVTDSSVNFVSFNIDPSSFHFLSFAITASNRFLSRDSTGGRSGFSIDLIAFDMFLFYLFICFFFRIIFFRNWAMRIRTSNS